MKSMLYLLGYGVTGCLDGCTGNTLKILLEADEIIFRWELDPIFKEISERRKNIRSLVDFYNIYGPTSQAYISMAEEVKKNISEGKTVAYVTPGHPLVCEATSLILHRHCTEAGIPVEIIPSVSFIDLVTAVLGIDLSEGVQIIAGTEICQDKFQSSLSKNLHLLVASVRPDPVGGATSSELDELIQFLSNNYKPKHRIRIVSAYLSKKGYVRTNTLDTNIEHLNDYKDNVLRGCRVTYFVDADR